MIVHNLFRPYFALFFFLLCVSTVFSQDSLKITNNQPEITDTLNTLGQSILTDSLTENRIKANDIFKKIITEELTQQIDFRIAYDSLKSVKIITAPDSTFRLFTWQVFINDDEYKYEGIIQLNNPNQDLIILKDNSKEYMSAEFEQGDKDHWFGSLCYNIQEFKSFEGGKSYLLFGYNGHSLMERLKIIDVLTFKENQVSFGLPVFLKSEDSKGHPPSKSRVIIDYFAGAVVKVNYDPFENQILFDHLIFKSTPYGDFLIPDGSYEGYVLKKGYWNHVPKVYDHVYEEAPTPAPVFNKKKEDRLDIFGKKIKERQR